MVDALTNRGRFEIEAIGRRYDVPADAVATLLAAIRRGGGRQAQFSHPALGGMGQWSRGGGTMIGDMFDHALKAKVEQLCNALSQHADNEGLFAADPTGSDAWWPIHLGRPSTVGSQNEEAYACFPDARRLAVRDAEGLRVYDTGDHRIAGVSQQQGAGRDLTFSSRHGTVRLSDLTPVDDPTSPQPREPRPAIRDPAPPDGAPMSGADAGTDIPALLERLHGLQQKGILTEEELAAKKAELLARL